MTGEQPASSSAEPVDEEQPAETGTEAVGDIHALLELADLVAIRNYEVSGQRATSPDGRPKTVTETEQDLEVHIRRQGDELEIRFRMTLATPEADLVADLSVVFALEERFTVERLLLEDFIERVAVMTAFPYLRESIFSTATRLGADAPVMGLLRPGQFKVGPPSEPDADGETGDESTG